MLLGVVEFLPGAGEGKIFAVLPGTLEFGTMDHLIHIALGVIFLIGGFITKGAVRSEQRFRIGVFQRLGRPGPLTYFSACWIK